MLFYFVGHKKLHMSQKAARFMDSSVEDEDSSVKSEVDGSEHFVALVLFSKILRIFKQLRVL